SNLPAAPLSHPRCGGARMHVAVLGAAGTIAPAIVRDLAESEEVSSILLLDLDADRANEVADEQGGGKAEAGDADARSGLAGAISIHRRASASPTRCRP